MAPCWRRPNPAKRVHDRSAGRPAARHGDSTRSGCRTRRCRRAPGSRSIRQFPVNGFDVEAGGSHRPSNRFVRTKRSAEPVSIRSFQRACRGCVRAARLAERCEPGGETAAAANRVHARTAVGNICRLDDDSPEHQGAAVGQSVGKFRLSVTSSSTPQALLIVREAAPGSRAGRGRSHRAAAKDLAAFYRTVAVSLKPARDKIAELQKDLKALAIPTALVMRERVAYERPSAFVRRRGSFLDKGEQVYADVPPALHPLRDDQMPNRLGLARWLVDEENPLTARVAVNRAWEQFFGRGIVETSEDFGTQGLRRRIRNCSTGWRRSSFTRAGARRRFTN